MNGVIAMENKNKVELPKGTDAELRKDFAKSGPDLYISSVKMIEGTIQASFSYSKEGTWKDVTKFFDTWKQFQTYAEKFFAIKEENESIK
jgi:hypothetical protein